MAPNPTSLVLVAFKDLANAPLPRNKISNDGDEKHKELALGVYHEMQEKDENRLPPTKKELPRIQLTG